jgi:hypothetical protein
VKRSIALVAAVVGIVVLAPAAYADSGSGTTSTTETPTTQTPVTETPTTQTPTTEVVTETPVTTQVPTTTTVPTTGTPITTDVTTDIPVVDTCVADCIPEDAGCVGADCIPSVGGGIPTAVAGAGALPFTGIEDTIAPILLALTVVLGGVVAWRWAQLRESVAIDASRARPLPAREARSGYAAALRTHGIEQRARRVFAAPRVA